MPNDVEDFHDAHDDIHIDRLHLAFKSAFQWVRDRQNKGEDLDFAADWVGLLASALNDVRLTATPAIDADSPPLPFVVSHRIETELFHVARGGMAGGPTIDVLLQVWFDTEDMLCGYGVPLVFRTIPHAARMSDFMWHDLQDLCRSVTLATPSGRVVFLPDEKYFDWFKYGSYWERWMMVSDMHSIAGGRIPPSPTRGRRFNEFCLDLASGWIGDPALSGLGASTKLLDDFLTVHPVAHLLRIKILRESAETWRPVQLPF